MTGTLLAQATEAVETPGVDWWGVMPVLLLAAPAMVLLHVSSLVKRFFTGFYALVTILIALVTAGWAVGLWVRVTDDDRGPFSTLGGAFGVDGFSVFVTLALCASVVLAALLADDYLRREGMEGAELYSLILLSASGGVIMASSNDLIVTFLGLEILSLAVYVLAAMHLRRSASQEAGMKYFVLGAFSSAFFLYGIALVYGATGGTSLLHVNEFLAENVPSDDRLLFGGMALLLVGFGFKVSAVPFHAWSPDVYQGSPSPVVAYMSSGVKVAGFAGLLRVFVTALGSERADWQPIVYLLAVASLLGGAILAVIQTDVKRMMAYSSISHAGFILVGVEAGTTDGVSGALFYLGAYTFMVAGSFGVISLVARRSGDDHNPLADYRGLSRQRPALAFAFTVLLLAQAGVPLTSGFFAKFTVLAASIDARSFWLAIIAMLSTAISVFVYLRIIVAMYMTEPVATAEGDGEADAGAAPVGDGHGATATLVAPAATRVAVPWTAGLALVLAVGATLLFGILPGLLQDLARDAVPALVLPS